MQRRLSETAIRRRSRNQPPQKCTMRTIIVSTGFLFVSLTLLDIWVIKHLWLPIRVGVTLAWFWWIPFWTMQIVFPLALSMLIESKLPMLISYTLFIFGVEDTLFHLIAWNTIPEVYEGVYYLGIFFAPRREIVLFGNFVALAFLFAFAIGKKRLKQYVETVTGYNET